MKVATAANEESGPRSSPLYDVILCDIEGTTTPISFVHDVLFPYAQAQVEDHLMQTYADDQTSADLQALADCAKQDGLDEVEGVVPIPDPSTAEKSEVRTKIG